MTCFVNDADQLRAIVERDERERAERLVEARRAATAAGKEPFDAAVLATLCDVEQHAEYAYYVEHPELRTMAAFAAHVRTRAR